MNTIVCYRADGGTHFLEFKHPISAEQVGVLIAFAGTDVEPSRLTLRSDRDSIVALKWPPASIRTTDLESYRGIVVGSIGHFSVPSYLIFDLGLLFQHCKYIS